MSTSQQQPRSNNGGEARQRPAPSRTRDWQRDDVTVSGRGANSEGGIDEFDLEGMNFHLIPIS